MVPTRRSFPLLLILLSTAACSDADPYARPLNISPPVEVNGALVFHDVSGEELIAVVDTGETNELRRTAYVGTPTQVNVSPDGKALVMLDVAARKLTTADPVGSKTRSVKLDSEFSGFVISDDSKAAAVYHADGGKGASSIVNTAEVALVDLDQPEISARVATITGLSKAPMAAHVAPPVTLAGTHRLVWIDALSMIGVADFGPNEVRTMVVPLVAADSGAQIVPLKVVALAGTSSVELYLIAKGSNDVVHITVDLAAGQLGAALDQIASGAEPSDIHVFTGKDGLRVLTVNRASRDLALLDPSTGTGTYVSLEDTVDTIVPFDGSDGKPRAVLWRKDGQLARLLVVELDDLAKKKGKAVKQVKVDQPILSMVTAGDRFLLEHASSNNGLSLYDAGPGKLTAFAGTGAIVDQRLIGNQVFAIGDVPGGALRISWVEVSDTLHSDSITLNHGASALMRYGDKGVALAGPGFGAWWLALFPGGDLKSKRARWLEGFALEGLL